MDARTVPFATSFTGLGRLGNEPIAAQTVCERLYAGFGVFRRSWSPWNVADASGVEGQPPASG